MKTKTKTLYKVIKYIWTIKEDHNGDFYRGTSKTIWEYPTHEEAANKYTYLCRTEEVGKGFARLIVDSEVVAEENF